MPVEVPVLNYVLPDNFTPTHRAQLSKSHKKVEQILGVTPSLRPIPSSSASNSNPTRKSSSRSPRLHRRSKSYATISANSSGTKKTQSRLRALFGIESSRRGDDEDDDYGRPLYRVSTDSSSSSTTSSTESFEKPLPRIPFKPSNTHNYDRSRPRLHIDCANLGKQENNDFVLDIRPNNPNTTNNKTTTTVEADSPLTPLYKVNLPRQRSRASIIEEREWNKIIQGVNKLPIDPKEKARKLNRLGKVFGVMPPLEMVFPPTPTSRSRHDPKRYTLELPPPLVRGTFTDDLYENSRSTTELMGEIEESPADNEKVMRVVWDTVTDEASRQKVMDALRLLRG